MAKFMVRRFLWMVLVLFVVSLVTFWLMHSIPGGPFDYMGERAIPPEIRANMMQKYDLNKPLVWQYTDYMGDIIIPQVLPDTTRNNAIDNYLIRLPLPGGSDVFWMNFGPSYNSTSRSVNDFFRDQLPASAVLGVAATLIALGIGVPLGIIAALNRNNIWDYISMGIALTGVSVPIIIMGPVLRYAAVQTGWLPPGGWGSWQQMVLPSFALGFSSSALLARLTRASLLQVLNEDYIRTARAKGVAERGVVLLHALKNALIPVVTVIGPLLAALVTGTFVAERVFRVPGLGDAFVTSIGNRDYPLIMGTTLLYAFVLVIANTLVDMTYAWIDPRIRFD